MEATRLTIGEVARQAGVNRETLRYYERRGLVAPSARSDAGYRLYETTAPSIIRFIKSAQALGFSLGEVEELLSLRQNAGRTCGEVKTLAQRRLTDIEAKLAQLRRVRTKLAELVSACGQDGTAPNCTILDSLDHQSVDA